MRTVEITIKSVMDEHRFRVNLVDNVTLYNKDDMIRPPIKIGFRYKQFLFFKWIVGIDIVLNPYKFDAKGELKWENSQSQAALR